MKRRKCPAPFVPLSKPSQKMKAEFQADLLVLINPCLTRIHETLPHRSKAFTPPLAMQASLACTLSTSFVCCRPLSALSLESFMFLVSEASPPASEDSTVDCIFREYFPPEDFWIMFFYSEQQVAATRLWLLIGGSKFQLLVCLLDCS